MTTEGELQANIIGTTKGREGIAIRFGWEVLHIRAAPANDQKRWMVPIQGSMGKGWPDLILARGSRLIAAELKSPKGRTSVDQIRVLGLLAATGAETFIWRPSDWDSIMEALA